MSLSTTFNKISVLFRNQIVRRVSPIVHSGLNGKELLITCCAGFVIGIMPLPMGTTLLCFCIAWQLRLNQVVIQCVNYLAYPLQLVLYIPFIKLGAAIPIMDIPLHSVLFDVFHQHPYVKLILRNATCALVAWGLTAVPLGWLVYQVGIWRMQRSERLMLPEP